MYLGNEDVPLIYLQTSRKTRHEAFDSGPRQSWLGVGAKVYIFKYISYPREPRV
jgi:hypothetical protein